MLDNKKIIGTDYQLTFRMILTGFLLLLAYMALFSLLLLTGIPIFFVLIFGVGMVFFQYYMSDKLVLKTTRAKVVSAEEEPFLHQTIEKLSHAAGIPKPRNIAVMDMEAPNAFANA